MQSLFKITTAKQIQQKFVDLFNEIRLPSFLKKKKIFNFVLRFNLKKKKKTFIPYM